MVEDGDPGLEIQTEGKAVQSHRPTQDRSRFAAHVAGSKETSCRVVVVAAAKEEQNVSERATQCSPAGSYFRDGALVHADREESTEEGPGLVAQLLGVAPTRIQAIQNPTREAGP